MYLHVHLCTHKLKIVVLVYFHVVFTYIHIAQLSTFCLITIQMYIGFVILVVPELYNIYFQYTYVIVFNFDD